jgi:hypothetical protein
MSTFLGAQQVFERGPTAGVDYGYVLRTTPAVPAWV